MALKPWYKIVTPREDLREGKPLDASEFAVHLDQVRDGRAPTDYQQPERFFDRTYLTQNLLAFAAEVVRRLSGTKTETSAVFNLNTQFGGGKTHFLTLLYHLAGHGVKAERWKARLHRKVGTVVFFESNGGQARTEATVPEIRLAVAEPELDIGNVDTVLEALATSCYYLTSERNRYRFGLSPNLNKLLADRRASIQPAKIEERVRS